LLVSSVEDKQQSINSDRLSMTQGIYTDIDVKQQSINNDQMSLTQGIYTDI